MLLGDGHVAPLPALAELVEVGQQDVAEHDVDRQRGEEPVECLLGAGLVEAVERGSEVRAVGGGGRRPDGLGHVFGEREACGFRREEAALEVCPHRKHAGDILFAVEPEAALRAAGREQAVSPLPRAQ